MIVFVTCERIEREAVVARSIETDLVGPDEEPLGGVFRIDEQSAGMYEPARIPVIRAEAKCRDIFAKWKERKLL